MKPTPIGFQKEKAKSVLEELNIDVLIASTPVNVFYASGLPTTHAAPNPILFVLYKQFPSLCLINRDGEEALFTWLVYQSVDKTSWIENVKQNLSPKTAMKQILEQIEEWGYNNGNIGLESLMPRYQYEYLKANLPNAKFVDGDSAFLQMRLIKTEEEIERIKKSTEVAESTIKKMIEYSNEGVTDFELLKVARESIIKNGAECWDHITMNLGASDPEAPGFGYKMAKGDINRFDIGAIWKGYVSDVSRHVAIGHAPENAEETLNWLIKVQEYCVENIKPGINAKTIIKEAKKYSKSIRKLGRPKITGHSIGLECEEAHLFSPMTTMDIEFKENMVLDIEVWSVFKNYGLLGIEDCYIIRKNGCEQITKLDKNIFIK
ncbi:MAG: M24 family metallopeptidase [Promethearchaeota archaeon]